MTMKDIARLANVSQPTVSRVINGNPNVDKALAKRVMKVIEESGFTINKAAQTLKGSQSFLVGVSVTDLSNPYFNEVIEALEQEGREDGYNIILHNSTYNPVREWENIQNFLSRQVDGILLVPVGDQNLAKLAKLAKLKVPVIMTTQVKEGFDGVSVDHRQGVKLVAEHLVSLGHRKIGFVGPPQDEKLVYFKEALHSLGVPFDASRLIPLTGSQDSAFAIRSDIEAYLEARPLPEMTAVFCYNDVTALEFMRLMGSRGVRFPKDMALVGFDDSLIAKMFEITSVHQPIREMTRTAFRLLLERMKDPSRPLSGIEMAPSLIMRSSSGPDAGQ